MSHVAPIELCNCSSKLHHHTRKKIVRIRKYNIYSSCFKHFTMRRIDNDMLLLLFTGQNLWRLRIRISYRNNVSFQSVHNDRTFLLTGERGSKNILSHMNNYYYFSFLIRNREGWKFSLKTKGKTQVGSICSRTSCRVLLGCDARSFVVGYQYFRDPCCLHLQGEVTGKGKMAYGPRLEGVADAASQ
jgi:hypothetical protein